MGINEVIVYLNICITTLALFKLSKCMLISCVTMTFMKRKPVTYEMSEDKELYEVAVRFSLGLMIIANTLILLISIDRVVNDHPYSTLPIAIMTTLFCLTHLAYAHLKLMKLRGDSLNIFRKLLKLKKS